MYALHFCGVVLAILHCHCLQPLRQLVLSLKKKLSLSDAASDASTVSGSRVNDVFQKLKQRRLHKKDEDMVNKAVLPGPVL